MRDMDDIARRIAEFDAGAADIVEIADIQTDVVYRVFEIQEHRATVTGIGRNDRRLRLGPVADDLTHCRNSVVVKFKCRVGREARLL